MRTRAQSRRRHSHGILAGCLALAACQDDGEASSTSTATETTSGTSNGANSSTTTGGSVDPDDTGVDESSSGGDPEQQPPQERTFVLYGDTHVHTGYSFDAWLSLRDYTEPNSTIGELIYERNVREACDYARHCSRIDFMMSSEHSENVDDVLWQRIQEELRDCDQAYGPDAVSPTGLAPLHVFAGWEWTQGNAAQLAVAPESASPESYGHKNIAYRHLEAENLPASVITTGGATIDPASFTLEVCPSPAQCAVPFPDEDYQVGGPCFETCSFLGTGACDSTCDWSDPDFAECDAANAGCPIFAFTAEDLFAALHVVNEQLGLDTGPLVGSHGTTWVTGGLADWDNQFPEHDPSLAVYHEVYSKHGNTEEYYGPGESCTDCFKPTHDYTPSGSYQRALSKEAQGEEGAFTMDLAIVGSTDTHHARPGSVMQDLELAEVGSALVFCELTGTPAEECGLESYYTGGLAAVHLPTAEDERNALYDSMLGRHMYGTSGPRIELWFYMTNPPAGLECEVDSEGNTECPMGTAVTNFDNTPSFRVHAKGALPSSTECDGDEGPSGWSTDNGGESFANAVCRNTCFKQTSSSDDERSRILYFEVVRVLRGTDAPTVDTDYSDSDFTEGRGLDIEVFRLPCVGDEEGMGRSECWADFTDTTYAQGSRNAAYYVRAIQEPTEAINGATGTPEQEACDPNKSDCTQVTNERAWSSPIFVYRGAISGSHPGE